LSPALGPAFPMSPAARPALQLEYGRHPVALLRARNDPGFKSFADGEDTIEGTAIRRVRIVHEGLDVRLNLDRANRVHSVAFRERNAKGFTATTWFSIPTTRLSTAC
jgi:hypothetical protein